MRNVAETQYRIGALERALEILAAIGDAGEIPLGQLAARLQIPKGSLLRHLRVLEHAGYVTRAPQAKVYSLGPALIHLGFVARQRLRASEVAAPAMRWLRPSSTSSSPTKPTASASPNSTANDSTTPDTTSPSTRSPRRPPPHKLIPGNPAASEFTATKRRHRTPSALSPWTVAVA